MANIRIFEIEQSELTPEQLAIINASGVVFEENSQWEYHDSTSDITPVTQLVTSRRGTWTLSVNTIVRPEDAPPIVSWEYTEEASDAVPSVSNDTSRVPLRVSNLDLTPNPSEFYPDSFWQRNGQDIIPRSL